MSTVRLVSVFPQGNPEIEKISRQHESTLRGLAEFGVRHRLVEETETADVLLFFVSYSLHHGNLDPWRSCVRTHPLFRRYREKAVVLDLDDRPVPFWKGLFNSAEKNWYDPRCHRTVPYIHHRYLWNTKLEPRMDDESGRFLFSFVGNMDTHSSRRSLLRLNRRDALIVDTSKTNPWADTATRYEWARQFEESIHASKFVLCPRGRGAGSVRVYEVMKAGRVPVIISDDWVPPRGPDWDSFSIWVKEDQTESIPTVLERNEWRHKHMGCSARTEWEKWCSREVVFDRMVEWSEEIIESREVGIAARTLRVLGCVMSSPYQVRRFIAGSLKRV